MFELPNVFETLHQNLWNFDRIDATSCKAMKQNTHTHIIWSIIIVVFSSRTITSLFL